MVLGDASLHRQPVVRACLVESYGAAFLSLGLHSSLQSTDPQEFFVFFFNLQFFPGEHSIHHRCLVDGCSPNKTTEETCRPG